MRLFNSNLSILIDLLSPVVIKFAANLIKHSIIRSFTPPFQFLIVRVSNLIFSNKKNLINNYINYIDYHRLFIIKILNLTVNFIAIILLFYLLSRYSIQILASKH